MALGLGGKFSILERSPHDSCTSQEISQEVEIRAGRWTASRYNVQLSADNGDFVLWNTLAGSISVFSPEQGAIVRPLLARRGIEAEDKGWVSYLRKRGFLVREGSDEYRQFQHKFGQRHYGNSDLELMLLSSEDCNFRCEYCYEKFARGTMRPRVRSAIKKFVENRLGGLRTFKISWFGGEPLYGFEAIADLAPFFQRAAAERGVSYSAGITTNGYLLTPDVAGKLLSWGTKNIQVTIDGSPEDHDRLRHTRTGEGSFSTIYKNLLDLKARPEKFNLVIRINFDPENYPRLDSFIESLGRDFGGDLRVRMLLRPVGRWGGDNDDNLQVCGLDEQEEIVEKLTNQVQRNGLGNYDDLRTAGRFGSLACYAARPNHLVIGADGKVMKCTVALDTHDANVVGKITPQGELEIDKEKLAFWTEPTYSSSKKCKQCVILPVCQGVSCPYERLHGEENPCPPLRGRVKKSLAWTHKACSGKASRRVALG